MTTCTDSLHNMYPGACPTCDPQEYQKLLEQAPEGEVTSTDGDPVMEQYQREMTGQDRPRKPQGQMQGGYSDTY